MRSLEGCRSVVTGGAQGIGAAITRGLVAEGSRVLILDRQVEKARAVAAELGANAWAIEADLESESGCRVALAAACEWLGGLDVLVNNAAPSRDRGMIGRIGDTDWDAHYETILKASAWLSDCALKPLTESGRGSIINVSSILAEVVAADQGSLAYHVSKAGLDQLTRWLAVRCGEHGVRVNAVAPGLVDSDVGRKLTDDATNKSVVQSVVPLRRAADVREIAQAVVFLASKASSYITGQVLCVDGGLTANEVFGAALRAVRSNQRTP
jgi:NAD(P)-dependent dehydrogenase (short-subunit alcohol dehydrogenase family)